MTTYIVKAEDADGTTRRFYETTDKDIADALAIRVGEIYRNPKVVTQS